MNEIIRKVVDVTGERHDLIREIGRGGQGVVYQVAGGKYAIKLFEDRSENEIRRLENQLKEVKRLDLKGLPIARPIRVLRPPYIGYLMEFFSGMESLKSLVYPKKVPSIKSWYLQTGGLRRRLSLLLRIGDVLSEVHGKGLVYPDISPNNIFISTSLDSDEIGLIDADNIHYLSSPYAENIIYTPGYGAPELVAHNSGVNSLTDSYAFGVLVFHTLTLINPFSGDLVEEGEPELEESAMRGEIPWIEHSLDKSNTTQRGIPRVWVISQGLMKLSYRTFEYFLNDPLGNVEKLSEFPPAQRGRPGLMEWTEKLCQAANSILDCPDCGFSYYFNQKRCPWCNCPRPSIVIIKIMVWDPDKKEINQQSPFNIGCFTKSNSFNLSKRFYSGYSGKTCYEQLLDIQFDDTNLRVKNVSDNQYWLSELNGSNIHDITSQSKLFHVTPGQASWCLHLGSIDSIHRIALFEVCPEAITE